MKTIINTELPKTLSDEEFEKIFTEYKNGNISLEKKLVEHNLRLVYHIVNSYFYSFSDDVDDLFQVGCIGLIKSIRKYDKTKNDKFSNYSSVAIYNEIVIYIRKKTKNIPTDSLDKIITNDGKEFDLYEFVGDETDFASEYADKIASETLKNCLEKLNDRDKDIIKLYFGFYNGQTFSMQQIADKHGLSRYGVYKIIQRNIVKLKEQMKTLGIEDIDFSYQKTIKF